MNQPARRSLEWYVGGGMLVERLLDAGADINRRTVSVGRMPPPGKDNFLYRERVIEIRNPVARWPSATGTQTNSCHFGNCMIRT